MPPNGFPSVGRFHFDGGFATLEFFPARMNKWSRMLVFALVGIMLASPFLCLGCTDGFANSTLTAPHLIGTQQGAPNDSPDCCPACLCCHGAVLVSPIGDSAATGVVNVRRELNRVSIAQQTISPTDQPPRA
jgi:hypothetical protein